MLLPALVLAVIGIILWVAVSTTIGLIVLVVAGALLVVALLQGRTTL